MNEQDFAAAAGATLESLEGALEELDLDFEMKEGAVLEIELEDSKIIVNRHAAAREIWVAARSGGFHFRWDGAAWRDTRTGAELFEFLSRLLSTELRRGIRLRR
jgi:CyaY protein